jgi:hypothetical protein
MRKFLVTCNRCGRPVDDWHMERQYCAPPKLTVKCHGETEIQQAPAEVYAVFGDKGGELLMLTAFKADSISRIRALLTKPLANG